MAQPDLDSSTVVHLVVGPVDHGVTRFAAELAAASAIHGASTVRHHELLDGDVTECLRSLPSGTAVHLNVTDRLFGTDPERATAALLRLAGHWDLGVTLHDLPQASDGARSHARRVRCYVAVTRVVRYVVVSSEHERALLADAQADDAVSDLGGIPAPVAVVPLPVDALPVSVEVRRRGIEAAARRPREVAVLGFVYPGKGHAEVVDALPQLPPDVGLLVLGRASDGHADLVDALRRRCSELGRRFTITGYLPDEELTAAARSAAVGVAAHRHWSASGSIGTWLAAGRRPVVADHRYTRELAARMPGALVLAGRSPSSDPAGSPLVERIQHALADPSSTWLDPDVELAPTMSEVARAYAEVIEAARS